MNIQMFVSINIPSKWHHWNLNLGHLTSQIKQRRCCLLQQTVAPKQHTSASKIAVAATSATLASQSLATQQIESDQSHI